MSRLTSGRRRRRSGCGGGKTSGGDARRSKIASLRSPSRRSPRPLPRRAWRRGSISCGETSATSWPRQRWWCRVETPGATGRWYCEKEEVETEEGEAEAAAAAAAPSSQEAEAKGGKGKGKAKSKAGKQKKKKDEEEDEDEEMGSTLGSLVRLNPGLQFLE